MKFILPFLLAILIWNPVEAGEIIEGKTVTASFFCTSKASAFYLSKLAKDPLTTKQEMSLEMGIMVRSGECTWSPYSPFTFKTNKLIESFVDFQNIPTEFYELLGPKDHLYYGFSLATGDVV